MVARIDETGLKRQLLEDVRTLFRRNGATWKNPIIDVLEELRHANVRAVLFGGTLRSLLVSRVFGGRFGRPRDLDVVVSGAQLPQLEEQFREILVRRTRFGGLQLKNGAWQFDVWPVSDTWAFKQNNCPLASFDELPSTTTFNLEAVAVDLWPEKGQARSLFDGDGQFFKGILSRTVELNRDDSPFPELTVVRGLVLASELRFMVGPRFAGYIREIAPSLDAHELQRLQVAHYGHTRVDGRILSEFASIVAKHRRGDGVWLPPLGQLALWRPQETGLPHRINLHWLEANRPVQTG